MIMNGHEEQPYPGTRINVETDYNVQEREQIMKLY